MARSSASTIGRATAQRLQLPAMVGALLCAVPGLAEEAPVGRYQAFVDELLATWPAQDQPGPPRPSGPGVALTCFDTPGEPRYVGVRQEMVVEASLAEVAAILDDIPHYGELYPDLVEVSVVPGSRSGARYLTAWERRVPLFFVPNTRFSLLYEVDRARPGRITYRYRLQSPGRITQSDGLVVLEALPTGATRFVEYDFFEAGWGPLPVGMVWTESLSGVFLSDEATRLKAENPGWSYRRIQAEARRLWDLDRKRVDRCRTSSRPAPPRMAGRRELAPRAGPDVEPGHPAVALEERLRARPVEGVAP
jgi:hypothetical protein